MPRRSAVALITPPVSRKTRRMWSPPTFRISLSVGGRGTGFRDDGIVVDDPLNASDQYNESARSPAVGKGCQRAT